jgi:glycosyltransferase involved in cell wall biosynthesis
MPTYEHPYHVVAAVTNDLIQDQRMQRICATLVNAGYQVTFVGRNARGNNRHLITSHVNECRIRFKCYFSRGFLFYAEFNIRLFFFLLRHPFDVVCAVDTDTLPACFFASKFKRKPCVLDAHEFFSEVPELVGRPFVKYFWEAVASLIIPKLKYAYTVGPSLAKLLSERYGIQFEVIRNLPWRRVTTVMEKHPHQPFILLYQGMLNEGRGLEAVIKSMEYLGNIQLWIVGKGDLESQLAAQAASLIENGQIKWLGFLPPNELNTLTSKADLGLNLLENKGLSYYYSLANKAFDYIQAGIPSIQMNFPEYVALNDQFQVFKCIPDTKPENIAEAIRSLQENPEEYQRLCSNCRDAAEKLNWDIESEKLLLFYRRIFSSDSTLPK